MPILDQGDYWKCDPTPSAMRAAWTETLGEISALSGKSRTLHDDGRSVAAFVSDNRWVAECLECSGAFMVARWNPEGCCLGCGHVYKVRFPPDVDAGEAVLEQRLDPGTRNWNAHQGETIAQLVQENEDFGVIGAGVNDIPAEDPSHLFVIAASFDDHHDGDRYLEDGPVEELTRKLGTGYTVRWDNASGLAEVEVMGQSDRKVASISKAMGGATHEQLAALDPAKNLEVG